jgi:hypothetical protein
MIISIIPLKRMTTPTRSERKQKFGVKVSFTYYNDFTSRMISKLNPTKEEEALMFEEAKRLCYNFEEILEIDENDLTDHIKSNFRIVETLRIFDPRSVPIPAYILGIWLGDGTSSCLALTNIDKCIITEWCKYAYDNNMPIRKGEQKQRTSDVKKHETRFVQTYFISSPRGSQVKNTILPIFKNLNLIGNKHIPKIYLENDTNTRLELLAGLIDTDGSYKSSYEIFQKNKTLSDNIVELSRSLGFNTQISETIKKCTNSPNKNHQGIYYRMIISINQITPLIPVRCERKKQNLNFKHICNKPFNKEEKIIWSEYLDEELYITVKSFQDMEPNKSIPWCRLENFNKDLPANKSEAIRARYDKVIVKNLDKYKSITERIEFNPIENEWMDKYNYCIDRWSHKQNLPEVLRNWIRKQVEYFETSNIYESKKTLITKLMKLKPTSNRSKLLDMLQHIHNTLMYDIDANIDENIVLLDNNKLYIPTKCMFCDVKIGYELHQIRTLLRNKDEEINYDTFRTKTELMTSLGYFLDDYHLNKVECRTHMIIQCDINDNFIAEHSSQIKAAESLKSQSEIKSVGNGKRMISQAIKNKNKCYNYYWYSWLDVHKKAI